MGNIYIIKHDRRNRVYDNVFDWIGKNLTFNDKNDIAMNDLFFTIEQCG
ncbi:hypothetical protein [Klebsiella pneumoniae IS39]|nr:hypothetical protein [Klebsiella pneumoniae IS39]